MSASNYSIEDLLPPTTALDIITELESLGHSNIDIAMLFTWAKFKEGGVDQPYLVKPSQELEEYYENNQFLQRLSDGPITTKGTDYVWTHFLPPIASYRKPSLGAKLYSFIFSLDPGIKIWKISRELGDERKVNQFWYSIGGNFLQDSIYGFEEECELHANVLGLEVFDPELSISEMIQNARKLIENGFDYRSHPSYRLSKDTINPVYGHKILRFLATNFSFLCKTPLLPVESEELYKQYN